MTTTKRICLLKILHVKEQMSYENSMCNVKYVVECNSAISSTFISRAITLILHCFKPYHLIPHLFSQLADSNWQHITDSISTVLFNPQNFNLQYLYSVILFIPLFFL